MPPHPQPEPTDVDFRVVGEGRWGPWNRWRADQAARRAAGERPSVWAAIIMGLGAGLLSFPVLWVAFALPGSNSTSDVAAMAIMIAFLSYLAYLVGGFFIGGFGRHPDRPAEVVWIGYGQPLASNKRRWILFTLFIGLPFLVLVVAAAIEGIYNLTRPSNALPPPLPLPPACSSTPCVGRPPLP